MIKNYLMVIGLASLLLIFAACENNTSVENIASPIAVESATASSTDTSQSQKEVNVSKSPTEIAVLYTNYLESANAHFEQGAYEDAITDYSRAIELNSKNPEAYRKRGTAYGFLEDYENTIRDFTKAIELAPDNAPDYNNRGSAYDFLGDSQKAIQDFNKAIALDPNFAGAYNNRGGVEAQSGDFEQALHDFTKAIELDPLIVVAYYNRAFVYVDTGYPELAIKDFTSVIKLRPNASKPYIDRGAAYAQLGDLEQAVQDYGMAVELKPEDATAYFNRGSAYAQLNDFERAIQDFTKVIELNPDDAVAYHLRGLVHSNAGNLEAAVRDYAKAIELDPNKARNYFELELEVKDKLYEFPSEGFSIALPPDWQLVDQENPDLAKALEAFGEQNESLKRLFTQEFVREMAANGIKFFAINLSQESLRSTIRTTVNVIKQDLSTEYTLNSYTTLSLAQMKQLFDFTSEIQQEELLLGHTKAMKFKYTARMENHLGQEIEVAGVQYVVVDNSVAYIVSLTMPAELADSEFSWSAMEAVETFRLLERVK